MSQRHARTQDSAVISTVKLLLPIYLFFFSLFLTVSGDFLSFWRSPYNILSFILQKNNTSEYERNKQLTSNDSTKGQMITNCV